VEFNSAALEPYLRAKISADLKVTSIVRFGRGTSRETWFATFEKADGAKQSLVLRRDYIAGPIDPSPLDREYFIYERLGRTDVPISRVLWWEDDPKWTDRPFYVREHVEGSWNIPHFTDPDPLYDILRIAISKEHMQNLARVHAVDWQELGFEARFRAPARGEDAAALNIDLILDQLEQCRVDPVPIVLEAAAWMKERAPVAPRLCLCKGTNGLGEEIFRDGKLVAMSDWEESSIGDPAADFAFMQSMAPDIVRNGENIWSLQKALDYYQSVSGHPVAIESVRFYGLVRALKMAVFGQAAAASVHRDPDRAEIRQAWTGTEVNHNAQRILGSAMGWMGPLNPVLFNEVHLSVEQLA